MVVLDQAVGVLVIALQVLPVKQPAAQLVLV